MNSEEQPRSDSLQEPSKTSVLLDEKGIQPSPKRSLSLSQMKPLKTLPEEQKEQEKLREMLILLQQLFQREEATAKRVIECLYDIGTVNWINKNVPFRLLNPTLKSVIRFPRPVVKILALKLYMQPKCPKLIAEWLYSLVEFKQEEPIPNEPKEVEPELLPEIRKNRQEVKLLRQRVQVLTGALVMTITLFGGSFIWIAHSLKLTPSEIFSSPKVTTSNLRD